jgi:hypothetical protein
MSAPVYTPAPQPAMSRRHPTSSSLSNQPPSPAPASPKLRHRSSKLKPIAYPPSGESASRSFSRLWARLLCLSPEARTM